jgi:hypothetical protein
MWFNAMVFAVNFNNMKKMLFIEPLFYKVVAGTKTQTRREGSLKTINKNPGWWSFKSITKNGFEFAFKNEGWNVKAHCCKPRYKVGDICYLAEPYIFDQNTFVDADVFYKYDDLFSILDKANIKWQNKLFMPKKYARHYIKITGVSVERLFDITDEDCLAEGVEKEHFEEGLVVYKDYSSEGQSHYGFPKGFFFPFSILSIRLKLIKN